MKHRILLLVASIVALATLVSCPALTTPNARGFGIQLKFVTPKVSASSAKALATSRLLLPNAAWGVVTLTGLKGYSGTQEGPIGPSLSNTFTFQDLDRDTYTVSVIAYAADRATALFEGMSTAQIDSVPSGAIPVYLLPHDTEALTTAALAALSLNSGSCVTFIAQLADISNSFSLYNVGSSAYSWYFQDSSGHRIGGDDTLTVGSGATTDGRLYITFYNNGTAPVAYGGISYTEDGPSIATRCVIYDGNGSTGGCVPVDLTKYSSGVEAPVLWNSKALTKAGYQFAGWMTSVDGSGMDYMEGSTLTMGTAHVFLHAVWIPDTLTFLAYGSSILITGGSPSSSLVIPAGVTEIQGYAFEGNKAISSVTLSQSVKSIGMWAFHDCSGITSVSMPGVTSLETSAFYSCSSLTSVEIPPGLTSLGVHVFMHCGLTSIHIPATVTSINGQAFGGCANLSAITVDAGNPNYAAIENAIYSKDGSTLVVFPGGRSTPYTFPASVTAIGSYAFYYCGNLTSVTIPPQVLTIGDNSFDHSGLTSVVIPSTVTSLGAAVFDSCASLTNATIQAGVIAIGAAMFQNCHTLVSVTLGNAGLASIVASAFSGCSSLAQLYLYSPSPPSLPYGPFSGLPSGFSIHLPSAAIRTVYQSTAGWTGFNYIVP